MCGYGTVAVLAWRGIDHAQLTTGLSKLRPSHIALVLAISLLHIAGRAWRYHRLLLRSSATDYGWRDGFAIFLIGLSTSAVTPARAGDFVKAQLVRRHGVSFGAGVGLVLIERVLDLLVLAATTIGAGLVVSSGAAAIWARTSVVFLGILLTAVVALTNGSLRTAVASLVIRLLRASKAKHASSLQAKIGLVFQTWDAIFSSPLTFARYFAISLAVWAVEFAKQGCVLAFLGAPAPLAVVFLVYPLSILAGVFTLLPFSEGVVGLTGVALLAALGGVDPTVAMVAVVVDRCASSLPPVALAGASSLWRRRRARS